MSGTTSGVANLPVPSFVNDTDGLNPLDILNDMITAFQSTTNRILYPAQVERLLINLYAYRELLVRNAIQYTGTQNLVAFSAFPVLDYLGQNIGVPRLPSQPATVTLQFTLASALTVAYTLPQGTQVGTNDGAQIFATTQPLTFAASVTVQSVTAAAVTPGGAGNGCIAGTITILIGGNPIIGSVTNTNTSGGGFDEELDDHYRTRIQAAPNQFTNAGPSGAYRFFALSANASIPGSNPPKTVLPPTNTFHLGFWFNNPDDAAPCGFDVNKPTPFNGEHHAGPLAMISLPVAPNNLGPLCSRPTGDAAAADSGVDPSDPTKFACNP